MYKYTYVTVVYKNQDVVMAAIEEHRKIIDEYAKEGYRYVGMIPTEMSAHGCYRKIDLIFESNVDECSK